MNVQEYHTALNLSFDDRVAYEQRKIDATNSSDNILHTLKKLRASVSHARICEVMLTSNVDHDFINKSERSNARFNVYAAEKVANVARFIAAVETLNHYTLAIVKSAFALEENDMLLTHDDAQSACSLQVKCKDAKREKIIVKYQKHVAKNTATTQSSSSINTLQIFDILTETRDAANVICYKLNRENENTVKMLRALKLID